MTLLSSEREAPCYPSAARLQVQCKRGCVGASAHGNPAGRVIVDDKRQRDVIQQLDRDGGRTRSQPVEDAQAAVLVCRGGKEPVPPSNTIVPSPDDTFCALI